MTLSDQSNADDREEPEHVPYLRDAETGEPLSMERCPECGTIASIWHKLGCPNDPDARR